MSEAKDKRHSGERGGDHRSPLDEDEETAATGDRSYSRGSVVKSSPMAACPPDSPAKAVINRCLIETDLLDCMASLPGQLFYSTQPFEAFAA